MPLEQFNGPRPDTSKERENISNAHPSALNYQITASMAASTLTSNGSPRTHSQHTRPKEAAVIGFVTGTLHTASTFLFSALSIAALETGLSGSGPVYMLAAAGSALAAGKSFAQALNSGRSNTPIEAPSLADHQPNRLGLIQVGLIHAATAAVSGAAGVIGGLSGNITLTLVGGLTAVNFAISAYDSMRRAIGERNAQNG